MNLDGMTIAVDIDETIAASNARFSALIREDYGIEIYAEDISSWDYSNIDLDCDIDDLVQSLYYDDRYVPKIEPVDGALKTLHRWHDKGAEIIIATHRTRDAIEPTRDWLDKWNIPYSDIHCGEDLEKHSLDVDVLIDDWHENVIEAAESGIHAFLVLGSHNYNKLDDLIHNHELLYTPLDVMSNTPLSLISNPHLQWKAFDNLIQEIASEMNDAR